MLTGEELVSLPVLFNNIVLGHPVDVAVELEQARVLALEVVCGDDEHRFLPLPAARLEPDAIRVDSPLALIDASSAAFYRERAQTLRTLRGTMFSRDGEELGELADVVVLSDGQIVELVIEGPAGRRRVPLDERLPLSGAAKKHR